jgi:hypothetical protein
LHALAWRRASALALGIGRPWRQRTQAEATGPQGCRLLGATASTPWCGGPSCVAHRALAFSVIALMPLLASPAALYVAWMRSFPDFMVTVSMACSSVRVSASASMTGPRLSATGPAAAGAAVAAAAARLGSAGAFTAPAGQGFGSGRAGQGGGMGGWAWHAFAASRGLLMADERVSPGSAKLGARTQLCRELLACGARLRVILAAAGVHLVAQGGRWCKDGQPPKPLPRTRSARALPRCSPQHAGQWLLC